MSRPAIPDSGSEQVATDRAGFGRGTWRPRRHANTIVITMTGGGASRWREWIRWYFTIPAPVRLVWGVVLTYLFTARMASTRGGAIALFAAAVYGVMFVAGGLSADRTTRWARRHPWLDGAMLGPIVFLALASDTHLTLRVCALMGLGADALFVPAIRLRRRGEALA